MKEIMRELTQLEALNTAEEGTRSDIEKDLRGDLLSWQHLCGMVKGINLIVRLNPNSDKDMVFKACVRLGVYVSAKLALEAIEDEEDLESFPEELG